MKKTDTLKSYIKRKKIRRTVDEIGVWHIKYNDLTREQEDHILSYLPDILVTSCGIFIG
jgi:hypothetical protein